MALHSKLFVPFWVLDRYCTRCKRETKQRTFILRPIVALLLTLVTFGGFLIVWLLSMIVRDPTYCCRCGRANNSFSLDRYGRVHGP
jgi:hypothetical protein